MLLAGTACACGLFLAVPLTAARAANPVLLVTYTATSFQAALGDGTPIRNGAAVPAGSYDVQVKDDPNTGDQNPNFTLSGPGVNVVSDLNSTGMGIDGLSALGTVNLAAGSTYRMEDTHLGQSSTITFTTTATATAGAPSSGPPSGKVISSSSSSSGSTAAALAGVLTGSVSPAGTVALTAGGKPVRSLHGGRYRVVVEDRSRTAGLLIGNGSNPVTVAGPASVGKAQQTIVLSPGRWFYEPTRRGPKVLFAVTA
jgi:hypothetical protein